MAKIPTLEQLQSVYGKYFSDPEFWRILKKYAGEMGKEALEKALMLYYGMLDDNVPYKSKLTILGALGYLILPVDLIPDFIPGVGLTDDIGVLAFAVNQVWQHLSEESQEKARRKVAEWFPSTGGDNAQQNGEAYFSNQ